MTIRWPLRRTTSQTFFVLALVLGSFNRAVAQDSPNPAAAAAAVDWKDLTPQTQAALGDTYLMCNRNSRMTEIGQTADITGDGIPEAIVAYCRQGPFTSIVTLMTLDDGKPVLARFRSSKGKPMDPAFVVGASIKDGEGVKFLPFKHAVYDIQWHIDKAMKMDKCTVDAYVWNAGSGTFDQNESIGKEIATSECTRLSDQLEEETSQFAPKKKGH
jgi:hypothetical protein